MLCLYLISATLRAGLCCFTSASDGFVYLLFSSAFLRAKGAESIVYLTYIYRISIVFDSGLRVTLLLFDS